jgi:hypothetical protein
MIPLTEIFCVIDDFCKQFDETKQKLLTGDQSKKRQRACKMMMSEIITILIMFHLSRYRTFKDFYVNCVCLHHQKDFPNLVSYNRFVELMPTAFMPLYVFVSALSGEETGKYFVDSTKLPVCHNLRINRNKVFKGLAKRGKTSTGWFFGFKLHLIFNTKGELMSFKLTMGNVDDRTPVMEMTKTLQGWLFGDRGYIGQKLADTLAGRGLELITKTKKNMKTKVIDSVKEFFLSKRNMIETIIDQLKNLLNIDHSRHRSPMNFQVNILGGLMAYIFMPRKVGVAFHKLNEYPLNGSLLISN